MPRARCRCSAPSLVLHDQVREVFERSLQLARDAGYLKRRGMRVALDTTYILGRGAVKDTYNLLADGVVKLMRALAAVDDVAVRQWDVAVRQWDVAVRQWDVAVRQWDVAVRQWDVAVRQWDVAVRQWDVAHGYERYLGSSVKGAAAIDWSSQRERRKLLAEIVADADRLLELARQAQGDLAENSAQRREIVEAAELLGQLLLQDVERNDDGTDLKDGVSKDRMMSVHDPEMRHGRKSSSKRFDGHKAAIVVDTETQWRLS